MIHLDSDKKTLEAFLGGPIATNQLPIVVSFDELNNFGSTQEDTETNGVTAVTIAEAPGIFNRPVTRKIKSISICNSDTAAHKVFVQLNNDSTIRRIYSAILAIGSTLFYEDGKGWYVLDQFGGAIVPTDDEMESVTLTNSGGNAFIGSVVGLLAYTDFLTFRMRFADAVDGPATANINDLGALTLVNFGDASLIGPSTGAPNVDIKAGQMVIGIVDLPNNRIQIQSVTDNIVNAS